MSRFGKTFFLALFATYGCKPSSGSKLEFAANTEEVGSAIKALNIAIVIKGSDAGIPGISYDFDRMIQLFDRLKFDKVIPIDQATNASVISAVTEASRLMLTGDPSLGAKGDEFLMSRGLPGGTFALYITSHGGPGGYTQMADGSGINMSEIVAAMQSARGNRPFQRLVTLIDTCHSDSNRDAIEQSQGAVSSNSELSTLGGINGLVGQQQRSTRGGLDLLSAHQGKLYLSGFSFYSSLSNEYSQAYSDGSAATKAFIAAAQGVGSGIDAVGDSGPLGVRHSSQSVRFGDIAQRMITSLQGVQHPVICAEPSILMREYIGAPPSDMLPMPIGGGQGRLCLGENGSSGGLGSQNDLTALNQVTSGLGSDSLFGNPVGVNGGGQGLGVAPVGFQPQGMQSQRLGSQDCLSELRSLYSDLRSLVYPIQAHFPGLYMQAVSRASGQESWLAGRLSSSGCGAFLNQGL